MVEIPELGIKNSKLAEEVIKILQSTDDKFDLALQLVRIADEHIQSQTARDTIDIAIEMARTPSFELSERDWQKVRQLLESARSGLQEIMKFRAANPNAGNLFDRVDMILSRLPWSLEDAVFGKLSGNQAPDRPLTPYSLRIGVRNCLKELDEIQSIAAYENRANKTRQRELDFIIGRVRRALTEVLEIAGGNGGGGGKVKNHPPVAGPKAHMW
jgi:translation initiation factor 2B subunit (eIF-2B alpha/beta/delta family)